MGLQQLPRQSGATTAEEEEEEGEAQQRRRHSGGGLEEEVFGPSPSSVEQQRFSLSNS